MVPIPGASTLAHLAEDLVAADLDVPRETLAALDELFAPRAVAGAAQVPRRAGMVQS